MQGGVRDEVGKATTGARGLATATEVAAYLQVPVKTLYTWRYHRKGLGRIVLAAISDTGGRTWRRGSRQLRPADDPNSSPVAHELIIRRSLVRVQPAPTSESAGQRPSCAITLALEIGCAPRWPRIGHELYGIGGFHQELLIANAGARVWYLDKDGPVAATFVETVRDHMRGGIDPDDHYSKRHLAGAPIGGTLAKCDPFGTPSTSHWTGAAIIVRSPWTKTCIVTRSRTSTRPMPFSLAG